MFSQPYIFNDIFDLDPEAMDLAALDERFAVWAKRSDPKIVESLRDSKWEKFNGLYTKKSDCNKYRLVAYEKFFRLHFQTVC